MTQLADEIRTFILAQFLAGESPENLKDDTPLVTSGILDSLSTVMLVTHLEERYGIQVEAHEASVDNLNTIADIGALVQRKGGSPLTVSDGA